MCFASGRPGRIVLAFAPSAINNPHGMCGRYSLLDLADFIALFPWVAPPDLFAPRYNIAPSQPILMLDNRGGGTLDHAIWGLVPAWARPTAQGSKSMINARCETLAQKPMFRNSLRYKRCIIPASGFYEWKQTASGKQPYYVTLAGGKPMLFAGLWEDSPAGDGGEIRTACIITTRANAFIVEIHDRMPAILTPDEATGWIRTPEAEASGLTTMLKPYEGPMRKTPVSRAVNSPANESKDCIEPMAADAGTLFG